MNDQLINKPMLEAVHLTKQYEDKLLALDDLNFEVRPGEIFAMLGGNGAGKTTAINIFLNLIEPTSGEAKINGIASHVDPLNAKKSVAFVSENVMLYGNFSACRNPPRPASAAASVSMRRSISSSPQRPKIMCIIKVLRTPGKIDSLCSLQYPL